jgi:RNA polymerase sigma-70 factor (ECF subfamily)
MLDAQPRDGASGLAAVLPTERARLVRLCARLSGDVDAAEDLTQETLVEAWRNRSKLHDAPDPHAYELWLAAIARHVCQRWARARGRERGRLVQLDGLEPGEPEEAQDPAEWLAAETDIERDLERDELIALLDRALALLPPQTRGALVAQYVEGLPQAEIAARLGMSAGAIAVRLHRGKLALRRALATELRQQATAYGLAGSDAAVWQETRIWCPDCGRCRLQGQLDATQSELILRCPGCAEDPTSYMLDHRNYDGLLDDVKTFKPALNRVMEWADVYYRRGVVERTVRCMKCGRRALLRLGLPADMREALRGVPGVHVTCSCRPINHSSITGMALYTAEGRRFWREHPRLRTLPPREVEVAGSPALLVSLQSVTAGAGLDVLFARDTLQIVGIHGGPGG